MSNPTKETNNQLATVTKSIVPPPKKKDVIEATSTALFEDHLKKIPLMEAELKKEKAELQRMVRSVFAKNRKQFTAKFRFYEHCGVSVEFEADKDAFPEVRKQHERIESLQDDLRRARGKTRWDFVLELRRASDGQATNPTVSSMLSDPKIKAGLLKAGLALLAKPTAEDKQKAIPA